LRPFHAAGDFDFAEALSLAAKNGHPAVSIQQVNGNHGTSNSPEDERHNNRLH